MIGVMPTMLAEDQFGAVWSSHLGQSRVKERAVLVSMENIDTPLKDRLGQSKTDAPVTTRATVHTNHFHPVLDELLTDASDRIEAKNRRVDLASKPPNQFANEDFRTGHLHHVNDVPDPQDPPHTITG